MWCKNKRAGCTWPRPWTVLGNMSTTVIREQRSWGGKEAKDESSSIIQYYVVYDLKLLLNSDRKSTKSTSGFNVSDLCPLLLPSLSLPLICSSLFLSYLSLSDLNLYLTFPSILICLFHVCLSLIHLLPSCSLISCLFGLSLSCLSLISLCLSLISFLSSVDTGWLVGPIAPPPPSMQITPQLPLMGFVARVQETSK